MEGWSANSSLFGPLNLITWPVADIASHDLLLDVHLPTANLTSSGRALIFSLVISWFPSNTFLICVHEAMAAAGLGFRKSGKFRAKSSNQSWSPNSAQDAEHESAGHLPAVSDYPNRISKLALRRSQPLPWISYRTVRVSTSLLGPTRSRL